MMHFTLTKYHDRDEWVLSRGYKSWFIPVSNDYSLIHLVNNVTRVCISKTIVFPLGIEIYFTLENRAKLHPSATEQFPAYKDKTIVRPMRGRWHFKDEYS